MEAYLGGRGDKAKKYPLHTYQQDAVRFCLDRFSKGEKGAGLFLDPGLGKTRVALTVFDEMRKAGLAKKALIVGPIRPLYMTWLEEPYTWQFPFAPMMLHRQVKEGLEMDFDLELINYHGLIHLTKIQNRWDLIVLDESSFVKNWKTKRCLHLKKIVKSIPHRILLTGTPAPNSLADLFSQMYFVDEGEALGKTLTQFRHQFCAQGGFRGKEWQIRSGAHQYIHQAVAGKVLRMDCETYLDMPDLVHNNLYVKMDSETDAKYREFEKTLVLQLEKDKIVSASRSSGYTRCRQIATGMIYRVDLDGERIPAPESLSGFEYSLVHKEKLDALTELAESLCGKQLLIFYTFRHEAEQISKLPLFKKAPIVYGGADSDVVAKAINDWNAGTIPYMLIQWQAGSHGLNLQKSSCSDMACFSLTDSAENYRQAYGRIWRQGTQASHVRIHRLITKQTVEEVMIERLEGKFETEAKFLEAVKEHAKENQCIR